FFQAEDGIRDFHVTGVQTCALPICRDFSAREFHTALLTRQIMQKRQSGTAARELEDIVGTQKRLRAKGEHVKERFGMNIEDFFRSEERRVGKESRTRWSG